MEEEKRVYWRFSDGTLVELRENGFFIVDQVQTDEIREETR